MGNRRYGIDYLFVLVIGKVVIVRRSCNMLYNIRIVVGLLILLASCRAYSDSKVIPPDKQKIAEVLAGKVKVAKACWWGFNPEDSTDQLQSAINSGVPELIVDKMSSPWIVKPIKLISNQTIRFEKGVVILAKRGEFKGRGDSLFTAKNCKNLTLIGYGATFKMWRTDYDNPKLYRHGEWRMCLELDGCRNVNIYGLTLTQSGGDGIYLGTGDGPNKNIHIKDVICDKNYRQGISVINAENLLIENCILSNTKGTAPEAGIDFEPNRPDERIANCVMRNCTIENNAGDGIDIYLVPLKFTSADISLQFENCQVIGNTNSVRAVLGGTQATCPKGKIEFNNCVFSQPYASGIVVSKPATPVKCRFVNCSIVNSGLKYPTSISPIVFQSSRYADMPVGGVEFVDCIIETSKSINPMQFVDQGAVGLKDITGTLIIKKGNIKKKLTLTEKLLSKWMPIKSSFKSISYLRIDKAKLKPLINSGNGVRYNFGFARIRSFGQFLLYANKDEKVRFTVEYFQVGRYTGDFASVVITDVNGKEVHRAKVPFKKRSAVTFQSLKTGIYIIAIESFQNGFRILDSTCPIVLLCPANLIQAGGDYYFWVPAGTKEFAVRIGGGDNVLEMIRAKLINPEGELVDEIDNLAAAYQFDITLKGKHTGQIWCLRLQRPTNKAWEDHFVNLLGVPPLLAPSKQALLVIGE